MKIYDISLALGPDLPVYPGDVPFALSPHTSLAAGQGYNTSRLALGSHSGTHIDAPYHFLAQGARADAIPLDLLIGPARLYDLGEVTEVGEAELKALDIPAGTTRLLIKTRNSTLWDSPNFRQDFTFLTGPGARWLVERGVRLLGWDYLSLEQWGAAAPEAHLALLSAGVVIIEGLDLRAAPPGQYTLLCLPLKIKDGDGAPARVALVEGWP